MKRTTMNTRGLLAAGLIATLAGGAIAMEPDSNKESGTQEVNLGGPQVEDAGQPEQKAEREGPRLMEFMAAARSLRQSGKDLQFTAEQREVIGAAMRDHRAAMAEFMAEHKEEIDELREQAGLPERGQRGGLGDRRGGDREGQRGQRRGPKDGQPQPENEMSEPGESGGTSDDGATGGSGGQGFQPPTPEQVEAMDRLRELMAKGPDESAVVKKIQGVLTAEQNEAIDAAIIENRQRRQNETVQERRQRGPQTSDRVRGQRERRGERQRRGQRGEKQGKESDD